MDFRGKGEDFDRNLDLRNQHQKTTLRLPLIGVW